MGRLLAGVIVFTSLFLFQNYSYKDQSPEHYQKSVSQQSYLVKQSDNGSLTYGLYANEGEEEKINRLPDFSYAGYMGGGVALPDAPIRKVLVPVSGDNKQQIQDAIDEVSKMPVDNNGFRGKILLKSGLYPINGSLKIRTNGVVLAGEGQSENGTVLKAVKESKHTFIYLGSFSSKIESLEKSTTPIVSSYIPTGSINLTVGSSDGYHTGDTIVIQKTPNEAWLKKVGMDKYGWATDVYSIPHERVITAITGDKITINIPVVDPIKEKDGGGVVYKIKTNRGTKQSGIENLRLVSAYRYDDDEAHGWNGIKLQMAENCWVKNVTVQYFGYSAVTVDKRSAFNTIEDCMMLDPKAKTAGGRKYSFNMASGSFNLFQRCYTRGGRHDFVTGARVTGPNVFLDCYAEKAMSDIGPHHRWATGTLFDNVQGTDIRVRNRKGSGTGHGWAGAQTMFWNCISVSNKGMTVENPPGAINWLVGGKAGQVLGNGYTELLNNQVSPRSLYLAQLRNRLGQEAVKNVTTPNQRVGVIYAELVGWASKE